MGGNEAPMGCLISVQVNGQVRKQEDLGSDQIAEGLFWNLELSNKNIKIRLILES